MHHVFVSNAHEYTGPGVVQALSLSGYQVVCHDRSFTDPDIRAEYDHKDNLFTVAAQTPEDIVAELADRGPVSRFVFNDAHPNAPKAFEKIGIEEQRAPPKIPPPQAKVFPFRANRPRSMSVKSMKTRLRGILSSRSKNSEIFAA